MNNQKFSFDKIIAVISIAAVIAFAVYRNAQVTKQNEILKYPSATEYNYK